MISEILEEIRGVIVALYPTKRSLANPYDLPSNSKQSLENGYGIIMRGGDVEDYTDPYSTAINREIDVILTKGFKTTDLNDSSRLSAEASLISETLAVIKAIKQSPDVRSLVVDVTYASDTGIELVEAEKQLVVSTNITLVARYKEMY